MTASEEEKLLMSDEELCEMGPKEEEPCEEIPKKEDKLFGEGEVLMKKKKMKMKNARNQMRSPMKKIHKVELSMAQSSSNGHDVEQHRSNSILFGSKKKRNLTDMLDDRVQNKLKWTQR